MNDALKIPALFAVAALPLLLLLSFIIPPFQAPDEVVHYQHARMIANGDLLPIAHEGKFLGAQIEQGDVDFPSIFWKLVAQPGSKIARGDLEKASGAQSTTLKWQDLGLGPSYPPTAYIAASAGLLIGDIFQLNKLKSYYFGRISNSLAYILVGALAIYFTPVGKGFFALILLLPMSTFVAASFSSDAHTTAFTALLVALLAHEALEPRPRHAMLAVMAVILLSLSNTKLYLIFLLIPFAWLAYRKSLLVSAAYSVAIIAVFSVWSIVYIFNDIQIAKMATLEGVSSSGQLQYLMNDPVAVFGIAKNTMISFGEYYWSGLIGILGWLDTPLARWYYLFASAVIGMFIIASANSGVTSTARVPMLIAWLLGFGAVFGLLYLSWTQVGSSVVYGVQGRYFIPLLFPMIVSVSGLSKLKIGSFRAEMALIVVFVVVSHPQMIRTLVDRYYLQ